MSKIVRSAIWALPKGEHYPMIFTGLRHADIYEKIFKAGYKKEDLGIVEGFMTSDNRFVDRHEAFDIAYAENQIVSCDYWKNGGLYSEDLWPDE